MIQSGRELAAGGGHAAPPDAPVQARRRGSWKNVLRWIVIVIATVWCLFPFYWAIITSLKTPLAILAKPAFVPWLQFQPTLANWQNEFTTRWLEIGKALRNSLIISIGASIVAVGLGTLAGYGLARYRFYRWGNSNLALCFLSQRFLPPIVTAIPFFLAIRAVHLIDTHLALILANATFTMPIVVLVLRDVFKDMPIEIEESAQVDGASHLQAFWYVALPLAVPAIAAAAVISFAFAWNEFLFGLILSYKEAIPITVVIAGTEGTRGIQFQLVATRLLVAILPPTLLALTAQRYIVRGMTFGTVKG
jgi:multiple sugar transport system permease protein